MGNVALHPLGVLICVVFLHTLSRRITSFKERFEWEFARSRRTEVEQLRVTLRGQVAQQMPVGKRRGRVTDAGGFVHLKDHAHMLVAHDLGSQRQ